MDIDDVKQAQTAPHAYLAIMDETQESRSALCYAAYLAQKNAGDLIMLHILPRVDFFQWSALQNTLEEEAHAKSDALLTSLAQDIQAKFGVVPIKAIMSGNVTDIILNFLRQDQEVSALVLGAAAGAPGPLVDFFTGNVVGDLPCPVIIVPGCIDDARMAQIF